MYNAYVEAKRNGVYLRQNLDGYQTLAKAKNAVNEFVTLPKPAEVVGVVYFHGNTKGERRYSIDNYHVIERTGNVKAFFEFWG